MKKILKIGILGMLAAFVVLFVLYVLTQRTTEFNFANEGKIICVQTRDWGIISRGDLRCMGVYPLGNAFDKLQMTVQTLAPNGEIIIKK